MACASTAVNASTILDTGDTSFGDHTNNSVSFYLTDLPEHSEVTLNFDLFILDSWDGESSEYSGPDIFGFRIDGVKYSWTFRNYTDGGTESNPDTTGIEGEYNGQVPVHGNFERFFDDYQNGFTVPHTGNNLNLEFFGSGLQEITDESWRVQKISLKTVTPEAAADEEKQRAFIRRFYQLVLDREPDAQGFDFWLSQLANSDDSETAGEIARGFFESNEFKGRKTADGEFLDIAYRSFFDREADSEGKQYWMGQLSSGVSRHDVINGFIASQEFVDLTASFGIVSSDDGTLSQIKSFVQRFYIKVLDRESDAAGLDYWTSQLVGGTETGGNIARGFFESSEFIGRETVDSEFLDIAYRAFFDRQADSEGKQYWMDKLSSGVSRQEVVNGFIASEEFIDLAGRFRIAAD